MQFIVTCKVVNNIVYIGLFPELLQNLITGVRFEITHCPISSFVAYNFSFLFTVFEKFCGVQMTINRCNVNIFIIEKK